MKIGGISIIIKAEAPNIIAFLESRYAQFLIDKTEADYAFDVFISPGLSYQSPNPDESFFNRQQFANAINLIYANGYTGYLNKTTKKGKAVISNDMPETWLEHFLRFAFSWMALENNCLFFHGAGVIKDYQGYVFFGPSKAGKTTVTEFSAPHLILGDDMVLISKTDSRFQVHATPFNINMDDKKLTNASEQIKAFYRLRQHKKNYLAKMKNSKASAELLSCVPLAKDNFQGNLTAFSLCAEIAQNVPCYDLYFTRDNKFWRLLDGNSGKILS